MARSHARIHTAVWGDPQFTALSADAQWLYVAVLSQPNLTFAGVVAFTPRRWAGFARTMTPARIAKALAELVAADFVFHDQDTEEVAVRSFMKNDGVYTNPNVLKAAAREWRTILSATIRESVLAGVPAEHRPLFEAPTGPPPEGAPEGLQDQVGEGVPKPEPECSRVHDAGPPPPSLLAPSPSPAPAPTPSGERSAESGPAPTAEPAVAEEDEEKLNTETIRAAADVLARRDLARADAEGGRVRNRAKWLAAAAANRLDADGDRLAALAADQPDADGHQLADALERQSVARLPETKLEGVGNGVPMPDNVRALLAQTLKRAE